MNGAVQRWGWVVVVAAGLGVVGRGAAQGLMSQIRVVINNVLETEHTTNAKPAPGAPEKKDEHLEITLENASPKTYTGVTVHYYIFAEKTAAKESDKDKEITIASKGDQVVSVGPSGTLTITSAVAEVTYVPEHPKTARPQKAAPGKTVSEKFVGFGAQVEQGGKILGQYFEPVEMTNYLNAAVDGANKKAKKAPPAKPGA